MDFASTVRSIPDYPKAGIIFRDITTLLGNPRAFRAAVDALVQPYAGVRIDKVAGIEARGFILGGAVAHQLSTGFVPIRKKGKLPGVTFAQEYDLEYGTATVEVLTDAFEPSDRVLVIDDVLATGGTARAAADLVRQAGAEVAGLAVLLELAFLNGRAKLPGLPVSALLTV
jgi:adenine phosphoribosyltransferase